jgi:hypothetical protein
VTVYVPLVTEPTTKDPVTTPLDTEHVDDETNPACVEDIPQLVSDGLKSEPETVTVPPTPTEEALSAIVGSTVNEAEAQSAGQPRAPIISIV